MLSLVFASPVAEPQVYPTYSGCDWISMEPLEKRVLIDGSVWWVAADVDIEGGYGELNIPLVFFSKFNIKQRLTWMGGLSTPQRCAAVYTAIVGRILVSFLLDSG